MPYKDPEKQRSWQREYQRRKRAGLPTKGISPRKLLTDDEKKERGREYRRRKRNKEKTFLNELIGKQCYICDSDRSLMCHQMDGKEHNADNYKYTLEQH